MAFSFYKYVILSTHYVLSYLDFPFLLIFFFDSSSFSRNNTPLWPPSAMPRRLFFIHMPHFLLGNCG